MADLEIKDLHVSVDNREILKGISLGIDKGEVHAVMGPNGSGKSTLSNTLMGHPGYTVESGEVRFKGQNIVELTADERSRLGLFLALQYPIVVPGITMNNFLRTALTRTAATTARTSRRRSRRRSSAPSSNPIWRR